MSKIKQDIINELHKPARKKFKRRRVIIKGLDETFEADLVEMKPYAKLNKNYNYILVVIDIFSKYVWAKPVKNKTATDVTNAMQKIFKLNNRIPKNLHTDLGREFKNGKFKQLTKKYNINHYFAKQTPKASIVERVNRTLKNIMYKKFSMQGSYKWLKLLPIVISEYNNKIHSTINMKPINVTKKNEQKLLNTVYNRIKIVSNKKPKFQVNDNVRISKYRGIFAKGYMPNWSNEIFIVKKIKLTNPTTYILEDNFGQLIDGAFYEQELQKVKHSNVYLVEKILKKKNNKVYVKWLGFDNTHNSWINKNEIA